MSPDQEINAPPHQLEASSWLGLSPGDVLDDKYQIVSRLGEGGMCFVFKAEHLSLKRIAAVKLLKPKLLASENAVARFMQEAKALSELKDPNIVEIFSVGTYEQSPYVALEFLDGVSLADLLDQQPDRKLPLHRAVAIFVQICDALSYAHGKGVVHRDLKPSNVVVLSGDQIKLVDFGIAKLLYTEDKQNQKLTQSGSLIGTPQYMSPEQCLGGNVDARSDLYSMGCLMHEVLTGEPPFTADSSFGLLNKHVNKTIPIALTEGIDPILRVIAQTLEKDPNKRPQSAAALKQQILSPPNNFKWPVTARTAITALTLICLAMSVAVGKFAVAGRAPHSEPELQHLQKVTYTAPTFQLALTDGQTFLKHDKFDSAMEAFDYAENLLAKESTDRERKLCIVKAYQARTLLYSGDRGKIPRAAALDKYVIDSPLTDDIGDAKLRAYADYETMGLCTPKEGYEVAQKYWALANQMGNSDHIFSAKCGLGKALTAVGRFAEAVKPLEEARRTAGETQPAAAVRICIARNYLLWSKSESGALRTKLRAQAIAAYHDVLALKCDPGTFAEKSWLAAKEELAAVLKEP